MTAHFYQRLLNVRFLDVPEVYVSVPETALEMAELHMPKRVKFLTYKIRPTVTNKSGKLDEDGFLALLRTDREFCREIQPDLLLGDPGIRNGLLGEQTGIPWEALMHGCYLPLPFRLKKEHVDSSTMTNLAEPAWNLVSRSLDYLVCLGSDNKITSWGELRKRGRILIPNSAEAEPCEFGLHLGDRLPRVGFSTGNISPCVVTLCSSGDVQVPVEVLQELVRLYGEVAVVGPARELPVDGVRYLRGEFAVETVGGHDTVVISHGGHGTLKAVKHAARIIVVPGDLDQLCNAFVAHLNWGAELAIGRSWFDRINSPQPFQRSIDWQVLLTKLQMEIAQETRCLSCG